MGERTLPVQIELHQSAGTGAYREQLVRIYQEAFAPPPYNRSEIEVINFTYSLERHLQRENFRLATAREEAGGELVGFAYGYTSSPGQWWRDNVEQALGPLEIDRWLKHAFELVEFAVLPEKQGQGIGSRLHDALLEGLPHRTALLSTLEAETPALGMYLRRGWVTLLRYFAFPNVGRPYRIMGLDLEAWARGKNLVHG